MWILVLVLSNICKVNIGLYKIIPIFIWIGQFIYKDKRGIITRI